MPKTNPYNFFCSRCNTILCEDCKNIALEYAELEAMRKMELANADHTSKEASKEIARLKREVEFLRETLALGFPAIAQAYFNKADAEALLERVKNHNEHRRKMDEIEAMFRGKTPIDPKIIADLLK